MTTVSRRQFIGSVGIATTGILIAGDVSLAAPPKESGLSSEGLLVGHAGFQPRTTMPLPHDELPGFLSKAQLAFHHAEYARLVEQLHAAEQALRDGVSDPAKYAELRHTQVSIANGVLLDELYFTGLSAAKV